MNKKIFIILTILFIGITLTACKSKEEIDKDRGFRDYIVAGDKIGVSQVNYVNDEENDLGIIEINLVYVDSKTDVTFEEVPGALSAKDYGFISNEVEFTDFIIKKGGIELHYKISETNNGIVTSFEYLPMADHFINDSNGNVLYGFQIEQIPYVNEHLI